MVWPIMNANIESIGKIASQKQRRRDWWAIQSALETIGLIEAESWDGLGRVGFEGDVVEVDPAAWAVLVVAV